MKHLDLKFFWLCDQVNAGLISPVCVPTLDQLADILTKALPHATVEKSQSLLRLKVWFQQLLESLDRGGVLNYDLTSPP